MPSFVYPLSAARALALHAQGLASPHNGPPTPDIIYDTVERLGCVQMDTLHVVQRSHYLALWSRLGAYDPKDFDRLAYDPDQRRLFEGWQRCASLIPMKDYRYQMPHMDRLRNDPGDWYHRWLGQEDHNTLLPIVYRRVQQEGALRAADFKYDGPRRGSWWDWKPAKVALEYLYAFGDLMISNRHNFQRLYDLTERVLPAWVDTRPPTPEERDRFWIEQGVQALGICTPQQAADYSYRKRNAAREHLENLQSEGVFVPVEAELADGKVHTLIVHRDKLELLQQAAKGELVAERTTFLSPFDNLFWGKGRDVMFWGFRNVLEAYKPAPQRIWGYFNMPILHYDQFVGRFDPKLERKNGLLRLKALILEPGVQPEEELVDAVAGAMRDFLAFHKAKDLLIERSQPEEFGARLMQKL